MPPVTAHRERWNYASDLNEKHVYARRASSGAFTDRLCWRSDIRRTGTGCRGGAAMSALTALLLRLAATMSIVTHDVVMTVDSSVPAPPIVTFLSASTHDDSIHKGQSDLAVAAEAEIHTCPTAELAPPLTSAMIDSGSADVLGTFLCEGLVNRSPIFRFDTLTSSPGVRRAFMQVYLN